MKNLTMKYILELFAHYNSVMETPYSELCFLDDGSGEVRDENGVIFFFHDINELENHLINCGR